MSFMSTNTNSDKDNTNEIPILKDIEEGDDDEGFSIISDDEDNEETNQNTTTNEGEGGETCVQSMIVEDESHANDSNTTNNMEVVDDDDDDDEGFSIISDDDDNNDAADNIDTAEIDGSNELDFIRGIERSDPRKMTKAIIENAQKLMTEKREKLAQEVTNAMFAEAAAAASSSHKSVKDNNDENKDNNGEKEGEEEEEEEEEKEEKIENPNARILQQKARELNKIEQNLKALEELRAGECSETPTPSSTPTEAIADAISAAAAVANEGAQIQAGEDERAYLIRIGKITPFADKSEMERKASELGCSAIDGEGRDNEDDDDDDDDELCNTGEEFFGDGAWKDDGDLKLYRMRISKWKRNVLRKLNVKENVTSNEKEEEIAAVEEEEDDDDDDEDEDFSNSKFDDILIEDSDDESASKPGEANEDDTKIISEEDFIEDNPEEEEEEKEKGGNAEDDGDEEEVDISEDIDEKELFGYFRGSETKDFGDGFAVPMWVHKRLYGYQRVGVQWLWELHKHESGGILGDEMGLGKTVTIVSYVSSLFSSGKITAPVLVVCPATLMTQWAHEFHAWCAPVRVVIMHASGTAGAKAYDLVRRQRAFEALGPTVFLTTYEGVRIHQQTLTRRLWSYVILDEGHKIKNPDSMVTLACKNFKTPHRLIMSGTPIQNSLRELWSLFDFVKPHLLGTLPVFYTYFIRPISAGSFANASGTQAQVAFNASSALHHTIDPYLLRRVKRDVLPQLPKKREEVLLCALTKEQVVLYKNFLRGAWMEKIGEGKLNMLFGVDFLRKICNHPDLVIHPQKAAGGREWIAAIKSKFAAQAKAVANRTGASSATEADALFRSGKLRVARQLLRLWDRTGHKALLFCQTRQMLNIVEASVSSLAIPYLRMDGLTSMKARPALISKFNTDPTVKIFLLTTKVGGLGVNLTAADRVIIYDPDWNPAVDEQARERVLRIGQQKEVCIYRLLTAGTIEEKVYHRQLFKQSLQNSVLNDVRQKRLFREEFLKQLFSFNPDVDKKKNLPDTAKIFQHLPQKRHDESDDEEDGENGEDNNGNEENDDDSVKIQNESDISKIRDNWVPPKPDDSNNNDENESGSGDGKKKKKGRTKDSETSILKNILSVIDQETITDQDMIAKAEDLKANAEASSIVHEMLRSFTSMRRKIKDGDKFTPTWTGSHGKTGMPEKLRKKNTSSSGGGGAGRGRMFGAVKSNAAAPSSSAVLDNISKTYSTMQSAPSPTPSADRAKEREREKEKERKRIARKKKKEKEEAPKLNPGEFDLFNPPALPPPPPRQRPKEKRVHELDKVKPLIVQQSKSMLSPQRRMAQIVASSSSSLPSKRKAPQAASSSSAQQKKSSGSSKPPPPKVLKITDFFGTDKKKNLDEPIPADNYPSEPVKFAEKVFIDLTKYFMENDGSLHTEKIIKKFKFVVGEDPFKIRLFKKTLESMSVLNVTSKTWCLKDI